MTRKHATNRIGAIATLRLVRTWLLLVLSLPALLCESRAQVSQSAPFLAHQSWSTEEGLPQASVHAIYQSSDGYLWIATEGGIARFDGVAWKTYTHESNPAFTSDDVSSIAESPRGVLWFGTSDGLIRMEADSFRRITTGDGLPSSSILSLAADGNGDLLALTTAGLSRLNASGPHTFTNLPTITSMERTTDGGLWLLTAGSPLRIVHGSVAPLQPLHTPAGAVVGVASGSAGALWIATAHSVTWTAGAAPEGPSFTQEISAGRVQSLQVDREGTAWIGTNHGLFTRAPQPTARLQPVEALGGESILSLFQDREGNHWIGAEDSGVHVLRPRKFELKKGTAGLNLTAVVQSSDGDLWLGTREAGLHVLHADGTAEHLSDSASSSPVILSLAPGTHGDVWVGTPDGLDHIQHGQVKKYTSADGLPDDFIRSVLVSRDGSVWAGTRHGLAHIDHAAITAFTRTEGLASDSIGPLLESTSELSHAHVGGVSADFAPDLWIGTAAGLTYLHNGRAKNFPSGAAITALTEDGTGGLLVAVHNMGLARFVNGVFHPVRVRELPQDIRALSVDAVGFLWLRDRRGVYRAPVQALMACAATGSACSLPVSHYGVADGMPSDETLGEGSPLFWQTTSGMLLVCTRKGLAAADPAHLPVNIVPPPVVLQRFSVDDTEEPVHANERQIASGHRSFTFEYAGLSYTMPSRTRYRYKLEGFDRDWIDAGSRRTAYYTSLPGRHYRFHVIAANNDGLWNETGAELRFSIAPPFYLRWWFYLLLFVFLFAAVTLSIQLRLRDARRQFALVLNERNRVAREIHDTLAQDFVSVSLQLEIIAQLLRGNKLPQASEQIQATRSMVRRGLEAARQSIWDLRANVTGNSLPVRLRKAVETFSVNHPDTQVSIGGAYRKLDESLENEVLRIAGEGLSNIDRHAAATEVRAELRYAPDALRLTLRDNGRGFSPDAALAMSGHYGVRGMQERALVLGGRLTITSNPGSGTTVTLDVPLREQ